MPVTDVNRAHERVARFFCAAMLGAGCLLTLPVIAGSGPNDYGDSANWLCRPGGDDACAIDLDTTIVHADGRTQIDRFTPHPDPAIDCFYVYPTVSNDPTPNSDMTPGPEERSVIAVQFARFAAQCRTFAPLYRQVTLTALRSGIAGQPMNVDRELGYNDVRDAWNHYLEHDNDGRGVVLVGHSQGSGVLTRLLREEIEGKPAQSRLVSALLIGSNVPVQDGQDAGGAFDALPLCRAADQTGCVIAYVSFRASLPPPANARFGRIVPGMFGQPQTDGLIAACTNPADLEGGSGALEPYFARDAREQWADGVSIETPFVALPDMVIGECVRDGEFSYLRVSPVGSDDARGADIPGDVMLPNGAIAADWGLHLVDVHVAMGNLLDIVAAQADAWRARHDE